MSTKYKLSSEVPTEVMVARLRELSDAVTKGADSINREFGMRIPAEVDYDADLILDGAAMRIEELTKQRDYFIDVAGNGGGYWPPLSVEDALEDYEKNKQADH